MRRKSDAPDPQRLQRRQTGAPMANARHFSYAAVQCPCSQIQRCKAVAMLKCARALLAFASPLPPSSPPPSSAPPALGAEAEAKGAVSSKRMHARTHARTRRAHAWIGALGTQNTGARAHLGPQPLLVRRDLPQEVLRALHGAVALRLRVTLLAAGAGGLLLGCLERGLRWVQGRQCMCAYVMAWSDFLSVMVMGWCAGDRSGDGRALEVHAMSSDPSLQLASAGQHAGARGAPAADPLSVWQPRQAPRAARTAAPCPRRGLFGERNNAHT